MTSTQEPHWLHGHAHEPNPAPPTEDSRLSLELPTDAVQHLSVAALTGLPFTEVADCYIVSTGHGTSGPFRFGGVTLGDLLSAHVPAEVAWSTVDAISVDGFGTRVQKIELAPGQPTILLAYQIDGRPLMRAEGLVRLIVPSETDDALRQVKWIARLVVT